MQNDPENTKIQSPGSTQTPGKQPPDPGAAYMQQHYISPQLEAALSKRYEDYQKTYRDLVVRLTEAAARTQADLNALKGRSASLQASLDGFKSIASRLGGETASEFDYRDQSRLAQECRNVEHLRLEAFRLISATDAGRTRMNGDEPEKRNSGSGLDLPSLTFSQLSRMGFAFFLPLLCAICFSALLLAAALICAFNGSLVW